MDIKKILDRWDRIAHVQLVEAAAILVRGWERCWGGQVGWYRPHVQTAIAGPYTQPQEWFKRGTCGVARRVQMLKFG